VTGYRPRHELAHEPEPGTAPPVGSMCLEYERAIGAVPLGAPVPDADPWGIPPAGEWTDRLLAELREAPTVLDALEEPAHVDQLKQLAADVAAYMSAQNTSVAVYLLELADRGRTYLAQLREHL
jgi:hypothetical protein